MAIVPSVGSAIVDGSPRMSGVFLSPFHNLRLARTGPLRMTRTPRRLGLINALILVAAKGGFR